MSVLGSCDPSYVFITSFVICEQTIIYSVQNHSKGIRQWIHFSSVDSTKIYSEYFR